MNNLRIEKIEKQFKIEKDKKGNVIKILIPDQNQIDSKINRLNNNAFILESNLKKLKHINDIGYMFDLQHIYDISTKNLDAIFKIISEKNCFDTDENNWIKTNNIMTFLFLRVQGEYTTEAINLFKKYINNGFEPLVSFTEKTFNYFDANAFIIDYNNLAVTVNKNIIDLITEEHTIIIENENKINAFLKLIEVDKLLSEIDQIYIVKDEENNNLYKKLSKCYLFDNGEIINYREKRNLNIYSLHQNVLNSIQ